MCPWLTQMHKRKCFISQEEPSVPANTSLHRALHPGDLMALKIEAAVWLIIYWPTVCVTSGTELWSAQAIFVDTRYWILHLGKASRKIFGHSPLYVYLSSCEWKERKREERGEKLKKVHFIVFIHHKQNIFSSLAKPSWLIQHCLEKKKKVYIKSRLQSQKSLNLQKTRLERQSCWRLSKEMDLLSCKTIISTYVFIPF